MISNACPRCDSANVEIQPGGIFGCKECGKAEKSYLLKLRFDMPDESGKIEPVVVRHLAREMAGLMSDFAGPHLAVAMARLVEQYKIKLPPAVAKSILTQVIGNSFERMFQMLIAFLPQEMQLELNRTNALLTQANALAEMIQKEAANARSGPQAAPAGPPGGDGEAKPQLAVVPRSVDDADQPPPRGDLVPPGGDAGGAAGGDGSGPEASGG